MPATWLLCLESIPSKYNKEPMSMLIDTMLIYSCITSELNTVAVERVHADLQGEVGTPEICKAQLQTSVIISQRIATFDFDFSTKMTRQRKRRPDSVVA